MKNEKNLRILFITDPLKNFDLQAETTLYLMREANRRAHRVAACEIKDIFSLGDQVFVECSYLKLNRKGKFSWEIIERKKRQNIKNFDAVILRKDPPFDTHYLNHLYLLEMASHQTYMMNHPSGLLKANEKIFPLFLKDWVPTTLISSKRKELTDFIKNQKEGVILKPIGLAGGRGIYRIENRHSQNTNVILEESTHGFTRHVILQTYLPQAKNGDKRILLLGGEVLGAFQRKPSQGEHRANLHAGGKAISTKLTKKNLQLVEQLKPFLQDLKLDFVGLDLIGDQLIEVNVTSPMGLHELTVTKTLNTHQTVMDFIEQRIANFKK